MAFASAVENGISINYPIADSPLCVSRIREISTLFELIVRINIPLADRAFSASAFGGDMFSARYPCFVFMIFLYFYVVGQVLPYYVGSGFLRLVIFVGVVLFYREFVDIKVGNVLRCDW